MQSIEPGPFSLNHIILMIIYSLFTVSMFILFKKLDDKNKKILLIGLAIATFILTTVTRFTYFDTPLLPNTLCTLTGIVLPILVLLKKTDNCFGQFFSYCGIFGGLLVIFSGQAFNVEVTYYNLYINMTYHTLILNLGLAVIVLNLVKIDRKKIIPSLCCLTFLIVISLILKGLLNLNFDFVYFYSLDLFVWISLVIAGGATIVAIPFIVEKRNKGKV